MIKNKNRGFNFTTSKGEINELGEIISSEEYKKGERNIKSGANRNY